MEININRLKIFLKKHKIILIALSVISPISIGFFTPFGQDLYGKAKNGIKNIKTPKSPPMMIFIEGDKFIMGNKSGGVDESPHDVQINSFYIDTTEITQKYYNSIIKTHYKKHYSSPHWTEQKGKGDNVAVYYVNWFEAVLFCNARTKDLGYEDDTVYTYNSIEGKINNDCKLIECRYNKDKNGFRLPTEAEWEFVANKCYNYLKSENKYDEIGEYVSFRYNSDSIVQSTEKRKSIEGIKNIFGNVMEWCNDWYSLEYYKTSPFDNPQGPFSGDKKVVRGGSIFNSKDEGVFVPWKRHSIYPSIQWNSDSLRPDVGFRCAKNIK